MTADHTDRPFRLNRDHLKPVTPTDNDNTNTGTGLELVDFADLFAGINHDDAIIEGLAYSGRWTAIAAPAKSGKSTLLLHVALAAQAGREPFEHTTCEPISVLYLDAEMGRVDLHERLDELRVKPPDLTRFHYCDIVPKLDTDQGAALAYNAVIELNIRLVIIDGINGSVGGEENSDVTWRAFYESAIAPMKRAGIGVISADNLGKDKTLGPRGSSVKVDKPDAVIQLVRTDNGVKLTTTHRRTAAYPLEQFYAIDGTDGTTPINYRHVAGRWPAGTKTTADDLDRLATPVNASNKAAREALRAAGLSVRNETIAAALRFRRSAERGLP